MNRELLQQVLRAFEVATAPLAKDRFELRVLSDTPIVSEIPKELLSVGRIIDVTSNMMPSGVYFLYLGSSLVYIGQSINPTSRINEHKRGQKEFDRAFLIPVPAFMLDAVEGALIRHFRPSLNGKNTAPRARCSDAEALASIGMLQQEQAA